MKKQLINKKFGDVFKKYRLRSEIETLAEFGDLLAQEGIVYESSIFSRWQKGERSPNDRTTILAILKIFIKFGGITKLEETSQILEALDKRSLNENEKDELKKYFKINKIQNMPIQIPNFIGRENIIKDITWELIQKNAVLVYGMPGIGKTALSIQIGHILRHVFTDGIFWFRADIKNINTILDEALQRLNMEINGMMSINDKFNKIKKIVQGKSILFIFDNVDWKDDKQTQLIKLLDIPVAKLFTAIHDYSQLEVKRFRLTPYTQEEFFKFSNIILGVAFTDTKRSDLLKIANKLENLPIAISIVLKKILLNPLEFNKIRNDIFQSNLNIVCFTYDNKNLYQTLNYFYNLLTPIAKKILLSCALFDGTDFQVKIISNINNLSEAKTQIELTLLYKQSLVEKSINKRYRLHPAVKEFMIDKLSRSSYLPLVQYYIEIINKQVIGSSWYLDYLSLELDNIIGLMKRMYGYHQYDSITKMWTLVSNYIFYSGRWYLMVEYDKLICDAYKKNSDTKGLCIYLIEDIGRIYFYKGDIVKVKDIFNFTMTIAEKYQDEELLGLVKQKQGIFFHFNNSLEEAERYLIDSIKLLKKTNKRQDQMIKNHAYLGMVYVKKFQYKTAVKYLQYALKKSKYLSDTSVVGFINIYLGLTYLQMNQLTPAKKMLMKGYLIEKKNSVIIAQAMALEGLGKLYLKKGRKYFAQKYLENSLIFYKSLNMKHEVKQLLIELKKL